MICSSERISFNEGGSITVIRNTVPLPGKVDGVQELSEKFLMMVGMEES
jgi:hypothetical protein